MKKSFLSACILLCFCFSKVFAQQIVIDGSEYNKLEYNTRDGENGLMMLNVVTSNAFISFEVTLSTDKIDKPVTQINQFTPNTLNDKIEHNNLFIEKDDLYFIVNHMKYYNKVSNNIYKSHSKQALIPEINLNAPIQKKNSKINQKNQVNIKFENNLYIDSVSNIFCLQVFYFTQISATSVGNIKFFFYS